MATRSDKEKQKQVQDKCQAILGQLLREEDNKYCVDCDAKGPRWASWNLGIFVCIRCAGIHRNLGVHISKVKSVNLDTWTPEQVASLQQMGNSKARAVYEAYLPDNFRRPQTDSTLEAFVRAKYEQKKYIAKEWVPLPSPKPAFDIEEEQKRDRKKKQNSKPKGLTGVEIPPPQQQQQQQQPAALPRPHGAPLSSGNSPVASAKFQNQKPAASTTAGSNVDLLGLDIPTVENSSEDLFDAFISAAPLSSSISASSVTTAQTAVPTSSTLQNGLPALQQQQPPSSNSQSNIPSDLAGGTSERKPVMSKESILSLYSTANNPPPHQPVFGLQGGMYMAPGMYAQQTLQMGWPNPNMGGIVDPLMAQAAVQNAGNVAQIQQQMAALQLVNQQWQTGNAMPPNFSAFPPPSHPGPAPSRPNLQGQTLSTNLWQ